MRRFIIPAVTALAVSTAVPVLAQPAPPPPVAPAQTQGRPGPGGPEMRRMHHDRMQGERMHGRAMRGLFYRDVDRQLTTADVQKIAEALLLWHGQRDWRVTDVAEGPDNTVRFAFSTKEGGVVARFTMDRKTGRLQRVG